MEGFGPVGSTDSLALAVGGESPHKVLEREGTMFGLAKLVPLTPGVPPLTLNLLKAPTDQCE